MLPSQWTRLRSALDVTRRFETMQRRMAPGSLGGRTESASPVSASAKGVAVPKTVEDVPAAGGGPEILIAYWQDSEVGAPSVGSPFQFEYAIHNGATNISWSQTDRDRIELNGDGIYAAYARVVHTGTPATFLAFPIKRDNFQLAVASAVGGGISVGSGVDVAEPSGGTNGPVRLYHDSGGVTPTEAQLTVIFYPNGFTFQGS